MASSLNSKKPEPSAKKPTAKAPAAKGAGGKKAADPKVTKAALAKKKKKRLIRIGIIAAAVLVVLIVGGVIAYNVILDHYLEKINIVTEEEDLEYVTELITSEGGEPTVVEDPDLNGALNDYNLPLICNTKNVKNYLLLATDSRGKEAGRSDSMILVSVNTQTKKIILCSFMRDILAAYPTEPANPVAGKYDKLNHAHAYGGPELTMAVLKETFNIEVSHYARVNFASFRSIVDAMGGLDMYLTAAEAASINKILGETMAEPANNELHVTQKDMLRVAGDGVYHLTGVQALSHARNRSVGSDWARTQRQRDLIEAMAKKATTLSLSQLNNLLNTVLPLITTNVQKDELKSLIADAPSYLTFDIESTRIPGNGLYTEQNYNIIPDLQKNCNALYELVYGEKAPDAPEVKNPLVTAARPKPTNTTAPTTTTVPTTTTKAEEDEEPDDKPDTSSTTTAPTTTTKAEEGKEPDDKPDTSSTTTAPTTTTKHEESDPDEPAV